MFFWNSLAFSVIQWMLILNMILPPYHLAGASLPLDVGYIILMGFNILLLLVVQQRVVILEFSQEKEDEHTSFYSAILAQEKEMQNGKNVV